MCCTTLILRDATMATMQLTRDACCEICRPWQQQKRAQHRPALRMNWVVAIDENGRPRLRMSWDADPEFDEVEPRRRNTGQIIGSVITL